jgi:hypothetical protein
VGARLLKIRVENYVQKREPQMIRICLFKEKERSEGRSQLGGQWKEKEKLPMLNGQWKEKEKLPMLNGQWKEKEKLPNAWWLMEGKGEAPFHLFSFSP